MAELSDNTCYTEVDENPIEEFSDDIRFWAAEALENNKITENNSSLSQALRIHILLDQNLFITLIKRMKMEKC